jgi:hypothetical protein
MGIGGGLGGKWLGNKIGSWLGGKFGNAAKGGEVGSSIGNTLGSLLPFKKGGRVKRKHRKKKACKRRRK